MSLYNQSNTIEIEEFREKWYSVLTEYENTIGSISGLAIDQLASAKNILTELVSLKATFENEIAQLNNNDQITSNIRSELNRFISRLIEATERIIGDAAKEMKLASVEDSKNRSGLNKGIKNKFGRKARNVAFITSFPILLPLLCICACFVVFLSILTSLTGGGPDQTQNMQAVQNECGFNARNACERMREKIRERFGDEDN